MKTRNLYRMLALLGFGGMVSCNGVIVPAPMYGVPNPDPTPDPDPEQLIDVYKTEITVNGSIINANDHSPITGIRVTARDRIDFALLGETYSDEDGNFALPMRLRDTITITYAMLCLEDVDGTANGGYFGKERSPFAVRGNSDKDLRASTMFNQNENWAMYATPYTEYEVKGAVQHAGKPIGGIQLKLAPTPNYGYASLQFSAADGSYFIPARGDGTGWQLSVEDIDGSDNGGEFTSQQIAVSFAGGEKLPATMAWSGGRVRQTVNVELQLK